MECEKRQKMLVEKDISIKAYKQASLEGQKELTNLQNEANELRNSIKKCKTKENRDKAEITELLQIQLDLMAKISTLKDAQKKVMEQNETENDDSVAKQLKSTGMKKAQKVVKSKKINFTKKNF